MTDKTDTRDNDTDDVVARVLATEQNRASVTLFGGSSASRAQALQSEGADGGTQDREQSEREERAALRRVAGLSTELEICTEVEYRQLRLENVVRMPVYSQGSLQYAE